MRKLAVLVVCLVGLLAPSLPAQAADAGTPSYYVYTNRSMVLDYYDGIDKIRVTEGVPGGDYCKPCRIYRFHVPAGDDVRLRQYGMTKTYKTTGWHSFPGAPFNVYAHVEIGRIN